MMCRAWRFFFGQRVERDWNKGEIDWNQIDRNAESRVIVLTRTALNGKLLGRIHLRESFDVNVSRVTRGDVKLLATKTSGCSMVTV
ncbi:MAG: hypothetical protein ACLTGI_03740 [Hoylesella buccalis]